VPNDDFGRLREVPQGMSDQRRVLGQRDDALGLYCASSTRLSELLQA